MARCSKMDVVPYPESAEQWIKQMGENFTVNHVIGGSLQPIFRAEDRTENYLFNTFRGQNVLLDSFQGFYIDTLNVAKLQLVSNNWRLKNYVFALACFSNLFRRFRACEILYGKGYPLDGYALMRDIKDRTFMLAGVAHNMITLPGTIGTPSTSIPDPLQHKKESTRNRKEAEHRISHRLMGKTSGLSTEAQVDLRLWDDLFHSEVHGGFLSLIQEMNVLRMGGDLQVGPSKVQDAYTMYINRSAELGWMIVRLLPYLRVSEKSFGDNWHGKQQVLDDSFRYMVDGLGNLGKRIGHSFVAMMDTNFVFKEPFCYFEADGLAA
jgi:hypothetical protein